MIETDGLIYQTASIYQQTWHVGQLKARCLAENRCTPVELRSLRRCNPEHEHEHEQEMRMRARDRDPSNEDSIGIELVDEAPPRDSNIPDAQTRYQCVTDAQNASLRWLIPELAQTLPPPDGGLQTSDGIEKNPTGASTASW